MNKVCSYLLLGLLTAVLTLSPPVREMAGKAVEWLCTGTSGQTDSGLPDPEDLYVLAYSSEVNDYYIRGYTGPTDVREVIIPTALNGIPITVLGDSLRERGFDATRSFFPVMELDLVVIPEGIRLVRSDFQSFSRIRNLVIPLSLESVRGSFTSEWWPERIFYRGTEEQMNEAGLEFPDIPSVLYYYSEEYPERPGYYWHEVNGRPEVWVTSEETLQFTLTEDGTGYAVRALPGGGFLGDLVIPSEHEGLPVTMIEESAFLGRDDLYRVEVPDTVVSIGGRAFAGCEHLEKVSIPGSVEVLPVQLFKYDLNLTEVSLGEGIKKVLTYCFWHCDRLKEIVFPDSVASLKCPIRRCAALESVKLPMGITEHNRTIPGERRINNYFVLECPSLKYLEIPDSVTYCYGLGVSSCKNCNIIVLPAGLQELYAIGGEFRFFFKGTPEQWEKLAENESYLANTVRMATPYYYSGEEPKEEGLFWHYADGVPVAW